MDARKGWKRRRRECAHIIGMHTLLTHGPMVTITAHMKHWMQYRDTQLQGSGMVTSRGEIR
jgi:hypothetical protein